MTTRVKYYYNNKEVALKFNDNPYYLVVDKKHFGEVEKRLYDFFKWTTNFLKLSDLSRAITEQEFKQRFKS